MSTVKLSARGTVTLPREIRRRFAMKEEDLLIVEATAEGILLRPAAALPIEIYTEERVAEFQKTNEEALRQYLEGREKRRSRKT